MKKNYSTCDKCGKDIQYGEPHVNFCKYTEYVEYVSKRNRTESEVIDAVNLVTLCVSCDKTFTDKLIARVVDELFLNEHSSSENSKNANLKGIRKI